MVMEGEALSLYMGVEPVLAYLFSLFGDTESHRTELVPIHQHPALIPIRADAAIDHFHQHVKPTICLPSVFGSGFCSGAVKTRSQENA